MDNFSSREMVKALEQMKAPKSFFLDTFFRAVETHATDTLDIDTIKGKRRMAGFTRPTAKAAVVDKLGYTYQTFKLPYIKEKMPFDASQFMNRAAGQTVYDNSTPQERAAAEMGKSLLYLRERIDRREEWMAMKALLTGKTPIKGDDIDAEVDWKMASDHKVTLTSTAKWDAPTTAVPLTDFRTWRRKIQEDSGQNPDICIMPPDTVELFLACAQVKDYIANSLSRMERGNINTNVAQAANGATFIARIEGVDVYEYVEFFDDPDNAYASTQLMPAKGLLFGSTNADCRRHYGVIQDIEAGSRVSAVGRWWPKRWTEPELATEWLMLQSAPLPSLHQPDAFINVVTA